ncbi:11853_t:CDS:2 [Funneliformis mosseae]|uniref:11853_t:CDS:1 n=1 Tax=Funneliformis mosseae TaxID=27381 RepID=A0A9N9HTP3_FUNMO|nr:11853_t:CDS:2 [Funneliformis mosseae]
MKQEPSEDSRPVPANNPTSAQNQQELSANSLPNDGNEADPIPVQSQQKSSANSLLSNEISADQWKSSPYILSDDDEDLSSSVSVVTLLNNNNNGGQVCLPVQELFRKSPEKRIRWEIDDIDIGVDLQPKLPTQFQSMSNEFVISYWLAHHTSVLELAINIRNGLMNRIGTDGTTLTLTTLQHGNVLPRQSLPGISQHTKNQLQEECKALFLQTRNNSTDLYEELIIRMCNISKTDDRLGSLVKDVSSWYNMYRFRLHVTIVKLTTGFLSTHKSAREPYNEIDAYITDEVWKQMLLMYLKETDQLKLRKDQLIVTKLGIFVRMVTKKVLIAMITGKDTQQVIKTCDEITIDLKIPTKPGVVKESSVRELLG